MLEKIVIVTRKTRLDGLIERFNSRAPAKFYPDHQGGAFADDPRTMIAVAFRELAENAQKIGELNVTPDLLKSLLQKGGN